MEDHADDDAGETGEGTTLINSEAIFTGVVRVLVAQGGLMPMKDDKQSNMRFP